MVDFHSEIIDFGCVNWGTKFTRSFKIKNETTIDQMYTAENYSERPRLDSGFSVNPVKSPSIRPNEEFTFTVELVPSTVNIRCCDSFYIKHLYGVYCVLVARAVVKGPVCSISCSQLKLVCPEDKNKISKHFTLKNEGQCDANFQFTVDEHPLIVIQPNHGSISPSTSMHITITYTPVNKRKYIKKVFCLLSNHEPLVLDVYAWLKSDENRTPKIETNCLPTYLNGYHSFLCDVMSCMLKEEVPIVTLDKRYIDFSHCQRKGRKQIEFSVTNNTNQNITVVWHQGLFTKEFRVQPVESELGMNDCKTFSAIFEPLVRDKLFGTVLEAQVFLGGTLMAVPVEIDLKGDSFEELSCGWSAQYRVQTSSLVLPPCLPSLFCPSHATLIIHRKGHLPLAFCFHPPHITNFCVKPLQGVIRESFQIVIVQYQPKTLNEAIDTEKWLLTFNSNENVNQCFVKFGGSIETPHVIINRGKDVRFPPIHPGTKFTLNVDVYNPTRFSFWYNTDVVGADSDVLTVGGPDEIWPHEHRTLPLVFQPKGLGCLEAQVACHPILGTGVGSKVTSISVTALCLETLLTVMPDKLLLKKVLRDFKHKRVIEVTNSGDATITGSFAWEPDCGCNIEDFEINFLPDEFYLKPGDSLNVEVTITPFTTGEKRLLVKYVTSSSCHDAVLLPVTVGCVFPSVQVIDIRTSNSAPLFTKMHYWKLMRINKFNTVLLNLRPKETPEVIMDLPSYMSTANPLTVELLVENSSELMTRLDIHSLVSCDCPPVRRQVSFSVCRRDYNCPHRHQVVLEPASVNVQAESYAILKTTISYKTEGEMESNFLLQFTPEDYEEHSCSVKLRVRRTSVPEHTAYIDTTEPRENGVLVFSMIPVYIGDTVPVAQGFSLYNNTKVDANFEVDDGNLFGTPFKYVGSRNQIPSLSNHILMFSFLPYCCETFEEEIIITINGIRQKLVLRGTGVDDPEESMRDKEFCPRVDQINQINPTAMFLSTSHIKVGPIKPNGFWKDVFFVNNNTKVIVYFMFLSTKATEAVSLRVSPVRGLVQPGESVECRLWCHSSGPPSRVDITLACAHANYTQYAANEQALSKYNEDLIANLDYFTITDKGMENAEVTPPTENFPVKNYLTLGVTVDVRDGSFVDYTLPVSSVMVGSQPQVSEVREETKLIITNVLERLLWNTLNESFLTAHKKSGCSDSQYQQIKYVDLLTETPVPDHVTKNVMEQLLHAAWQEMFQLNGAHGCEESRCHLIGQTAANPRLTRHSSSGIPNKASITDSYIYVE